MSLRRRALIGLAVLAVGSGLLAAPASAGAAPAPAAAAAKPGPNSYCDSRNNGGDGPFYAGLDSSTNYDYSFSPSFALPDLDLYTPQGLATWTNWDGAGHSVFLLGAYSTGLDSRIYAIDADTNALVGAVDIAATHAGGIAVVGKWIYVENNSTSIRKYKASTLRAALLDQSAGYPYVKQTGKPRKVYGASFLTSNGNTIYSGKFNAKTGDTMYAYDVNTDGSLTTEPTPIPVPAQTQGLLVLDDRFIFSTSYNRKKPGAIFISYRYQNLGYCFLAPSMGEAMTVYNDNAYLIFESGSAEYSAGARNPITVAHTAPLYDLAIYVS